MGKMRNWKFYVAWVAGSDSADGEDTLIDTPRDLKPQFEAGNLHVNCYDIQAETKEDAIAFGMARCFMDDYTAHDTVTDIEEA